MICKYIKISKELKREKTLEAKIAESSILLIEMPQLYNLTTTISVCNRLKEHSGTSLAFSFSCLRKGLKKAVNEVLKKLVSDRGYIYGLFQFGLYGF